MSDSKPDLSSIIFSASDLRPKVLQMERGRPPEIVTEISGKVVQRFIDKALKSPVSWKGKRVGLYRAMPGELNLSALEKWLKDAGCRLCYPRVISRADRKMEFVEVYSGQTPARMDQPLWKKGPFGIEEPHPDLPSIEPSSLELIFVPGMAFGCGGERIGRGAGFYDRFLQLAPEALRVAITFDEQLFPKIEQKTWDQPVHWVLTERRDILAEQDSSRFRKWFFE